MKKRQATKAIDGNMPALQHVITKRNPKQPSYKKVCGPSKAICESKVEAKKWYCRLIAKILRATFR